MLHSRRRHRPGAKNFLLNFRKDPVFRLIVVLVALLASAIVAFVLLVLVLPDNPVKDFFTGESIKVVEYTDDSTEATPTTIPTEEATATPEPTEEATEEPEATEEKTTITAWITAESGLIVRSSNSTQSTKLGTLPYGAKIEIIEEGTWHYIEYEDGGGYVHSNYVYIGDSPPGTDTKNTNTSQTWTQLNDSTKILVEKIFYNGVTYYVADIETDVENISTAYSTVTDYPSEMVSDKDAILAINGDYYTFRDTGVIIRNGRVLRDAEYEDIAVLFEDGSLEVYYDTEITADELIELGAVQSWSFGPVLVEDSVAYTDFSSRSDISSYNPRTGIGMTEDGHYIFIVVDGRQDSSKGYTLTEFAALFEEYGCVTAYNLDGGGTSLMIFEDEIISSPSGGEERKISDIIYID